MVVRRSYYQITYIVRHLISSETHRWSTGEYSEKVRFIWKYDLGNRAGIGGRRMQIWRVRNSISAISIRGFGIVTAHIRYILIRPSTVLPNQ